MSSLTRCRASPSTLLALTRSSTSAGPSRLAARSLASASATTCPPPPSPALLTPPPHYRPFSSSPRTQRSDDPGGKPNDGSHSTIYDDFYNITESAADEEPALSIASISPTSITLSDGLVLQCPLFLLNGTAFLWDAPHLPGDALPNGKGWEEWLDEGKRKETWAILEAVEPKPEVLLLGTGKTVIPPPPALRRSLNDLGIQVDAQSSHNAASTFNVLQEEGRNVAIAVLPSERMPMERKSPGKEASASGPALATPNANATPGSSRSFSSSTRPRFAQTVTTPSSSSSSSSRSQPRSNLTLQHFLYQSQALSLYRSYLRASRGIPNPQARRETIDFYRSQYFAPGLNGKGKWLDEDLDKVRDWLAQGHRDLKMQRGSMMLGGDGSGQFAKLRGTRGM